MILTTHAIVGAALASFLPSHPIAAFVAGFASHFALDAIPHVDYPIKSRSVNPRVGAPMAFDRALLRDAVTIGSDGLFVGMSGFGASAPYKDLYRHFGITPERIAEAAFTKLSTG